jgi:transcriptional regulator with XRE-family HTH domain
MGTPIQRIDQIRLEKGLSQRAIAEGMGISQSQYGKLLRGENRIQLQHLENLYSYLKEKIDLHWILTGIRDSKIEITIEETTENQDLDNTILEKETVMEIYNKIREESPQESLNYYQEIRFRQACRQLLNETTEEAEKDRIKAGKVLLKIIANTV